MNKAERLAVAGAIAPTLRENASKARARRVALIDEDGNVTGYTTLAEVQRSLLERHKIEIDVQPGSRPESVPCSECGLPVRVRKTGKVPTKHPDCTGRCTCGRKVSRTTGKHGGKCASCAKMKDLIRNCVDCLAPLGTGTCYHGGTRCIACAGLARRRPRLACSTCGKELGAHASEPKQVARRGGRPPMCRTCSLSPTHTALTLRRAWATRRAALTGADTKA